MSETNVIPIGLRPTTFDNAAPPSAPPLAPYQTMNNGYETRQYGGERGGDPLDAYGKRVSTSSQDCLKVFFLTLCR